MNFKLKSLAMAGTCAVALVTGTNVMAWGGTAWTDIGGTTHYNFGGRSGTSWTDIGGTTHFSGDLFRGGTAWTDIGGTTHYNFGGRSGTSWTDIGGTTHFSGDLFRGKLAKKLFADEDIAKKADVIALQNAIMSRNVDAITSCAWDLKGIEMILGKKDTKTTSAMLFNAAAHLAVEQGNAKALKQIVALAPECKKFESMLVMRGKTRGTGSLKSAVALPQLAYNPEGELLKSLKNLQEWEQPILDGRVCSAFRGMPKSSADTATLLINQGRITANPQMIAMGALELSKFSYDQKFGVKLDPNNIFAESVELAILKNDKSALSQIAALYNTSSLKNPEYSKYLASTQALMGASRGRDLTDDDVANAVMKGVAVTVITLLSTAFL